jgi:hypothetical protein
MNTSVKNFGLILVLMIINLGVVQSSTLVNPTALGLVSGGNNVSFTWNAPPAATYKLWVKVLSGSTATNATYWVYPKGNLVGNTACSSLDVNYPCFKVQVNQSVNQNSWVQLTLNNKATTQWKFNNNGYVIANPNNLSATQLLSVATILFKKVVIQPPTTELVLGQSYQGGRIFYLDSTKQHGLIGTLSVASGTSVRWNDARDLCYNLVIDGYSNYWHLASINDLYKMSNYLAENAPGRYWSSNYLTSFSVGISPIFGFHTTVDTYHSNIDVIPAIAVHEF